jgi:uncharacterized membrane protein
MRYGTAEEGSLTAVAAMLALWLAFGFTHVGLASAKLRPRLVGALGERGYQGLYSLVALAIFIPLVWVYAQNRHAGATLWTLESAPVLLGVLGLGMGLSLVLVVAGLLAPSPVSLAGGALEPRGVHRITRHPLFMGIGLFGLLHLIAIGSASNLVFFGGFPVFALVGCRHQDRRKLAGAGEELRDFYARTAFLPFTGPETMRGLREFPLLALGIGIALTVVLRLLH